MGHVTGHFRILIWITAVAPTECYGCERYLNGRASHANLASLHRYKEQIYARFHENVAKSRTEMYHCELRILGFWQPTAVF